MITVVWKHECIWTRNGGFWARARTRFSTIVHSTSSSCIMMSFFNILMAYNSSVPFLSASITFPKEPFPNTIKKLKSVARIRSLPFIFAGTIGSCLTADFWLSVGGYIKQNNLYLKILPYDSLNNQYLVCSVDNTYPLFLQFCGKVNSFRRYRYIIKFSLVKR